MKKYNHLVRSLFCIILIIILKIPTSAKLTYSKIATFSEAYIPSEDAVNYDFLDPIEDNSIKPMEREISDTDNRKELNNLIREYQDIANNAHDLAEATRALGYDENHPIIEFAKKEYKTANEYLKIYTERLNEINSQWESKFSEYPIATEIWLYLKDQGFNDTVCAGILGNIMAEVGGQTLYIQHTLSNRYYYGMCQWSKGYSKVWYTDLNTQCEFLINTIEYEFDNFGYMYKKNFGYNSFLKLTNEQDAALAFAKVYERCGSSSHAQRQKNATIAYNYFVN